MLDGRGRNPTAGTEEHWSIRARSVDRGIFGMENKHSEPSLAICSTVAVAGGHIEPSNTLGQSSADTAGDKPHQPLSFKQRMIHRANHADVASNPEERPTGTNRTYDGKTPAPRVYRASTPQSFERAQDTLVRRRTIEAAEEKKARELIGSRFSKDALASSPHSPDRDIFSDKQEATRAPSSSSVNSTGFVTSPSDIASPVALGSQGQFFASVPSLPALVSSGSSVCADPEGDFLQQPGVVSQPQDVLNPNVTPETIPPPHHSKHGSSETEAATVMDEPLSIDVDEEGYNGDGDTAFTIDDDVDSDSDEGLTMTRRKRHAAPPSSAVRRGTGGSVGSTETAKAMGIDG